MMFIQSVMYAQEAGASILGLSLQIQDSGADMITFEIIRLTWILYIIEHSNKKH